MIGALTGEIFSKSGDSLILMTHGVGYLVYVPHHTLEGTIVTNKLTLWIHTHVREDILTLFGFATQEEYELFLLLLGVSGIGPKTALAILDRGVEDIRRAIFAGNVDFFTDIPRLGTKNAQKVIIELKTKVGSIPELQKRDSHSKELVETLMGVGFTKREILSAVEKLPRDLDTLEDKVKFTLKLLGTK